MGILPLVLPEGVTRNSLKLDGTKTFDIVGIEKEIRPGMMLPLAIHRADGKTETIDSGAASIHSTKWTITATAASCPTSCAA